MTPYWLLFALPALLALTQPGPSQRYSRQWPAEWIAAFLVLAAVIGLRHEVGADWEAYLHHLDLAQDMPLSEALSGKDPAYGLLNWMAVWLGGSVHWVNTACACVFAWGLVVML